MYISNIDISILVINFYRNLILNRKIYRGYKIKCFHTRWIKLNFNVSLVYMNLFGLFKITFDRNKKKKQLEVI